MAFPSLDPLLWRVVGSGMWRHHEIHDGTYDVCDFLDCLQYLIVKDENQRRYNEAAARERAQ